MPDDEFVDAFADEEPQGTPDLIIEGDLEEPEEGPPPTPEEAGEAAESLPPLRTGADLLDEMEEIPPLPPLSSDPHGPHPPEGLRFDFAWERSVVPADAGDRMRERITDETALVPLPLSAEAIAEWSKSIAIWMHGPAKKGEPGYPADKGSRPGEQDYSYLLRKGHVGALAHLYPADPEHPRHRSAPEFAELLVRHGFTEKQAIKEGKRRADAISAIVANRGRPGVARLAAEEERHFKLKDEFSKAFVQAQSKKEKGAKK